MEKTLLDFGLSRKSQLVNSDGQIINDEVAARLLNRFRNELGSDVGRVDSKKPLAQARREAKNLNTREQLFFKLLLQRELGLDFGDNDTGKANAKAFFFTVGLKVLDSVNPSSRTGRSLQSSDLHRVVS